MCCIPSVCPCFIALHSYAAPFRLLCNFNVFLNVLNSTFPAVYNKRAKLQQMPLSAQRLPTGKLPQKNPTPCRQRHSPHASSQVQVNKPEDGWNLFFPPTLMAAENATARSARPSPSACHPAEIAVCFFPQGGRHLDFFFLLYRRPSAPHRRFVCSRSEAGADDADRSEMQQKASHSRERARDPVFRACDVYTTRRIYARSLPGRHAAEVPWPAGM